MALVNTMEQLVDMKVGELVGKFDCCKCERCVEDIKCIALNHLPAKYVSTSKGELFSRVNNTMIKQHSVDIDVAVLAAISFVMEHPRHN